MEDHYDDFTLELSDLEEEPVVEKKPARKKYTVSEKAKQAKADNLKKGREKRLAQLAQKKQYEQVQKKTLEYDDDEYTDESDYSDEYEPEPVRRAPPARKAPAQRGASRREPREREPAPRRMTKQEMKMQDKMERMENLLMKLADARKPKKRTVHTKTIIMPQAPAAAPEPKKANPQQEKAKKYVLDIFD